MLPSGFLTKPIAHRTLHDVQSNRPENSLSGAVAAIEHGYGIEIDVQMSKDGVPVVFHDYSLERLTSVNGAVAQRTATELAEILLKYGSEGIPTLQAMLELIAGEVPVLIEIKDQDGALGPNTAALEKAITDLLQDYSGEIALMSFNPHSVARCAEYAPEIPRGLVTERFSKSEWSLVPEKRLAELNEIPDYERVGSCFLSHNCEHLSDEPVGRLKNAGAQILCWTVKSVAQEEIARKIADNITFEGYLAAD